MPSESNENDVADPGGGGSGQALLDENKNITSESPGAFASSDFLCNDRITKEIARMMRTEFMEILESLELLSSDLLTDAVSRFEIKNGIKQGTQLGSVISRMFNIWLAKSQSVNRTYQTLTGHIEKYDPSLAERLREPKIIESMRRLAQPTTSAHPLQEALSSSNLSTTIEIEAEGVSSINTEQMTTGEDNQPSQSARRPSSSVADSGSLFPEQESKPLTDKYGAARKYPHQRNEPGQKYKLCRYSLYVGAVLLASIMAAGGVVVWYNWFRSKGTDLPGDLPPSTTPSTNVKDLNGPTTQVTPLPPPIENDPLMVSPDQTPSPSNESGSPIPYQILTLTDPTIVSSFGCLDARKQWLNILPSSTQDWVKLKLPSNCRLENVHGLQVSGDINLRSLWYLLSKFKYLRHLKFRGLSIYLKPGNSPSNIYNRDRIRMEYLQDIVVQNGQVHPKFYELLNYLETTALQALTIENTTLTVHVIHAVQDLILRVTDSEAFTRLNLNLVSVGTHKLFDSAMCSELSHSRSLEIHVKLPYLENADYHGLKSNIMEFRGCADRTYYKYLSL